MTEKTIARDAIRGVFYRTMFSECPDGWAKGHVTLTMHKPDERHPVEAAVQGPFAIHETTDDGYRLSHVPTGCGIWTFSTMENAASAALRIGRLADFTQIKDPFKTKTDLGNRVRAVIDEIEFGDVA